MRVRPDQTHTADWMMSLFVLYSIPEELVLVQCRWHRRQVQMLHTGEFGVCPLLLRLGFGQIIKSVVYIHLLT